jgi:hypothetical protein
MNSSAAIYCVLLVAAVWGYSLAPLAVNAQGLTVTGRNTETRGLSAGFKSFLAAQKALLDSVMRCGALGQVYSQTSGKCLTASPPNYRWQDAALQFQQAPNGEWGQLADLKGPQGSQGSSCDAGICFEASADACVDTEQIREIPCQPPLSGVETRRRTQNCETGRWSAWEVANSCDLECVPSEPLIVNEKCPAPFSGTYNRITEYACDEAGRSVWSGVRTEPDDIMLACTIGCEEATENRVLDCPSGQAGTFEQSREKNCPDGSWTVWLPTTPPQGACTDTCEPSNEQREAECATGYDGVILEARSMQCPSGQWSSWQQISNSCVLACEPQQETRTIACDGGRAGSITQERSMTCPAKAWTDWQNISDNCQSVCPNKSYRMAHGEIWNIPASDKIGDYRMWNCTAAYHHRDYLGGTSIEMSTYHAWCKDGGWNVFREAGACGR